MRVRELLTRWGFKTDTGPVLALNRAINTAKSAAAGVAKGLGIMSAAAVGAGAGVFALTAKLAEHADEMMKSSRRTGLGAEFLQQLGYVAKKTEVPFASVTAGMKKLALNAYAATHGNKAAAAAFTALGVALKDGKGNLLSADEVAKETLYSLASVTDETQRLALAQKLMGRGGSEMLLMLSEGRYELAGLYYEAKKSGKMLGGEALSSGEKLDDSLRNLGRTVEGLKTQFVSHLLPFVEKWVGKLERWIGANKGIIAQALPKLAKDIADGLETILNNLKAEDVAAFTASLREWLSIAFRAIGYIGTAFSKFGALLKWLGTAIGETAAKVVLFTEMFLNGISETKKEIWAFFGGIWGWLTSLPGRIWTALVDGFREALAAVERFVTTTMNKLRTKLGKAGKFLFGEEARPGPAASGLMTMGSIPVRPATTAAAMGLAGGGAFAPATTINVTVPPGTPETLAQRTADAVVTANAAMLRRSMQDLKR